MCVKNRSRLRVGPYIIARRYTYDATALDPIPNSDGTPRLKLLWHSDHIPNNAFNHSKFCPPVVADGQIFVATYDGRVDVYGLHVTAKGRPRPTNTRRMPQ
jgi:hypothetical protein